MLNNTIKKQQQQYHVVSLIFLFLVAFNNKNLRLWAATTQNKVTLKRFKMQHVHLRGDDQAAVFCSSLSNLPPIWHPKCGGMFRRLAVHYYELPVLPVLPGDWWSTWGVIISPDENSPGSFSTPFLPSFLHPGLTNTFQSSSPPVLILVPTLSVSKLFLLHVSFHQTPSLLIQSSSSPLSVLQSL